MVLFADPADMPPACEGPFAAGGLFGSRAWYRNVIEHGLPDGTAALLRRVSSRRAGRWRSFPCSAPRAECCGA